MGKEEALAESKAECAAKDLELDQMAVECSAIQQQLEAASSSNGDINSEVNELRQQLQQAALSGGDQDSKVKQMEVEVESLSSQLEVGEQEFQQVLGVVHDLRRAAALRKVYQLFDIDCKGQVGEAELMEIGQVRQQLSQQ